jgi:hypothetical protein
MTAATIILVARGHYADSVVAFDLGESIVCEGCAAFGLPQDFAILFGDEVECMTAVDVVFTMDQTEFHPESPECGSCGEKVITEEQFTKALESFR